MFSHSWTERSLRVSQPPIEMWGSVLLTFSKEDHLTTSTTRRVLSVCIVSAFLCGVGARASASSLILNGSFETPAVAAASYAGYGTGSGITSWTVVNNSVAQGWR